MKKNYLLEASILINEYNMSLHHVIYLTVDLKDIILMAV